MQFVKPDINIDFITKRKIGFFLSGLLILISCLTLLIHRGPRYGIDFSGGTLIQIKFQSPVNIDDIKSGLGAIALGTSSVQRFGDHEDNEYLIRTDQSVTTSEGFNLKVEHALKSAAASDVEIRRVEMVGPQVGKDLREKALLAMFYALLLITIYISGRFESFAMKWIYSIGMAAALIGAVYIMTLLHVSIPLLMAAALVITIVLFWFLKLKYAMGAIVALIHDVIITVGVFSIFDKEFTLPIIAALLTIIGYSLNDTIIVYDRIRENLRKHHKSPMGFVINRSINETLNRTILTSTTTLIVLVMLFMLGGSIIHDFSFAMIVGVIIGTYSSIFVASPILLVWQERKNR